MKELVEHLVRALVSKPEEVVVEESEEGGTLTWTVRVAPDEVGKVIGRQGRMIQAIRTLVKAASTKSGRRTAVEIAAPEAE